MKLLTIYNSLLNENVKFHSISDELLLNRFNRQKSMASIDRFAEFKGSDNKVYYITQDDKTSHMYFRVYDSTPNGLIPIGSLFLHQNEDGKTYTPIAGKSDAIFVNPEYRRKGIAMAMYDFAENIANIKIIPAETQSSEVKKLWAKRKALFGESKNKINDLCNNIPISQDMVAEVKPYNTSEEFLRSGGFSIDTLDRAAFGFTVDDIKTINPKQLKIKWKDDLENVKFEQEKSGLSKLEYAKKINLSEPIDVVYEKNNFYIDDGHHRYYAAMILKKPLNVSLTIKQNPIIKLGGKLGYDDFHRCVFDRIKKGLN